MKFFTGGGAYDWMIVGLGNPGKEYKNTRHNAGFMVADSIAEEMKCSFKKSAKMKAETAECRVNRKRLLLVKPQTFMNNSGEAVRALAQFYKMPADHIVVVFDDISLPVGRIRIRRSGSDGGHNGMKSIIENMGTNLIPRIKVGIGNKPHPEYDLKDWVLSNFSKSEMEPLSVAIENAKETIDDFTFDDFETPMNKFNKK